MLLNRLGIGLRLNHHFVDLLGRSMELFLVLLELAALLFKPIILSCEHDVLRRDGRELFLCCSHVFLI